MNASGECYMFSLYFQQATRLRYVTYAVGFTMMNLLSFSFACILVLRQLSSRTVNSWQILSIIYKDAQQILALLPTSGA